MRFQSNDELFASVCREPLPNILHHSSQSFIIAQCCESIQREMLYKAYTLVQSNHNLTTFSITQSYSLLLSVSGLLTDSVKLTLFLDYYNQVWHSAIIWWVDEQCIKLFPFWITQNIAKDLSSILKKGVKLSYFIWYFRTLPIFPNLYIPFFSF